MWRQCQSQLAHILCLSQSKSLQNGMCSGCCDVYPKQRYISDKSAAHDRTWNLSNICINMKTFFHRWPKWLLYTIILCSGQQYFTLNSGFFPFCCRKHKSQVFRSKVKVIGLEKPHFYFPWCANWHPFISRDMYARPWPSLQFTPWTS